jgi:hypothetical protein
MRGLVNVEISEIFLCISKIEVEPQPIWDAIESVFHEDFFEDIIFKRYKQLFDSYNPETNAI